jgi:hypothetical protein
MIGVAAGLVLVALPARSADDPWSEDARWVSMRVGTAGSGATLAADGSYGYGFGYTWFLGNQLAWSATVQHDVLGRYGDASEIEVPITVEFTKHIHLADVARPYLGGGWGAIYHKTYRTGADESGFRQGLYLALGGNTMLNAHSLIGVDARLMLEQDTRSINPTFPNHSADTRNWSLKLSYSRVL